MPHFDSPALSDADSRDTLAEAFLSSSEEGSRGASRGPAHGETQQASRDDPQILSIDRGRVSIRTANGAPFSLTIAQAVSQYGREFIDDFQPGASEEAPPGTSGPMSPAASASASGSGQGSRSPMPLWYPGSIGNGNGSFAGGHYQGPNPSFATQRNSAQESRSRGRSDGEDSYGVPFDGRHSRPSEIYSSDEQSPAPPEGHFQGEALSEEHESQPRGRSGGENDYGVPYLRHSAPHSEQSEALSGEQAEQSRGRSSSSSPPRRVSVAPLDRRPPPW